MLINTAFPAFSFSSSGEYNFFYGFIVIRAQGKKAETLPDKWKVNSRFLSKRPGKSQSNLKNRTEDCFH